MDREDKIDEAFSIWRSNQNKTNTSESELSDLLGAGVYRMYDCPQCGEPTEELHEGYCEQCCHNNQQALDDFNREQDRWKRLTDEQRYDEIRRGCA